MSSSKFLQNLISTLILSFSLLQTSKSSAIPIPDFDFSTTSLDPTKTGFTITPNPASSPYLGLAVSTAGDINKDGYADIIVGSHGYDSDRGMVYVIYGEPSSSFSNIDFSSLILDPATTGFTIKGQIAGSYFGRYVNTAGDINNDGYSDIIISAYGFSSSRGRAYVIYGGPKASMANIDLSTQVLDPTTTGFTITGKNANDVLGNSVGSAGDINKDKYDEILIGANGYGNNRGAAYIIYGGPKSSMTNIDLGTQVLNPTSNGFTLLGANDGDRFGRSSRTAGDMNNDGYDDIVISSFGWNTFRGMVYVLYGGEKSSLVDIDFSSPTLNFANKGFTVKGVSANDNFGQAVNTAGDINNDGYNDIIIGASLENSNSGAAYIIYGGPKSSLQNIDLSITSLIPTSTGFAVRGNGGRLGCAVSTAGDVNNDGYDDIIVGALGKNSPLGANTGYVYVIYGGPKSSQTHIDLVSTPLNPTTTGFTIKGGEVGGELGSAVGTAGDINNDGFDDIIFSAPKKDTDKGIVYIIHAACLVAHCDSCLARKCQVCDQGYGLSDISGTLCEACPTNCHQCTSSIKCNQCTNPYLLYQSWCLPGCPTRTFSSNDICKECPIHCSSCTSEKSCQTCDEGYALSDSLCVQPRTEAAAQAVANSVRGIGSAVSIGSATSPMTALVSKIVQNTRYLNISVTDELAEIYKTWDTDLISWDVPDSITEIDHYKTSPEVFARYGLGSSFLENFWATLMTIALSIAILISFFVVQKLFEQAQYDNWPTRLVKKFVAGSFNFALVQAYGCFDDILFYLIIDLKTNPFNTLFSCASLLIAIGFLALGCFLVFYNIWKVSQYQKVKNQAINLKAFTERNKRWELFYSDFNDSNIWSQSTLAFLVVRSSLSSLIITALFEYPLMQTGFLVIFDGVIILFLFFRSPFNLLRGKLAQYYFEAITLLVHLCTLILALQDTFPRPSETVREILSTGIIYLNTALISGSLGFLFIEIYKTISQKTRESKQKKTAIQEDSTEVQSIISHSQSANMIQEARKTNDKQVTSLENSQILPQDHNTSFTDGILRPFNHFNSSIKADGSALPDMNNAKKVNLQRNQNTLPIVRYQSQPKNKLPLIRILPRHVRNFENIDLKD